MKELLGQIQIRVNENLYLKDPYSSELGMRIFSEGAIMIHEMGLELFTFGKLAKRLDTTESSVYRYFENKYMLFLYLMSWYWGWMEYQLTITILNISTPLRKLELTLGLLVNQIDRLPADGAVNMQVLKEIMILESSKAYFLKLIPRANKAGVFSGYNSIVKKIGSIILEINPDFKFPNTLVTLLIEGIRHQKFIRRYLPALIDGQEKELPIDGFFADLALTVIQK